MHYIFLCRKKGNMEYLKLNELTKKKLEVDLGQVFRHIFSRIFIEFSSFA